MLDVSTANWLLGALVLAVGVLLPIAAVARNNNIFGSQSSAKRDA